MADTKKRKKQGYWAGREHGDRGRMNTRDMVHEYMVALEIGEN